jgi:uncharacterized membrane protein
MSNSGCWSKDANRSAIPKLEMHPVVSILVVLLIWQAISVVCLISQLHVVLAQAGIHAEVTRPTDLDSRLRGNDGKWLLIATEFYFHFGYVKNFCMPV